MFDRLATSKKNYLAANKICFRALLSDQTFVLKKI